MLTFGLGWLVIVLMLLIGSVQNSWSNALWQTYCSMSEALGESSDGASFCCKTSSIIGRLDYRPLTQYWYKHASLDIQIYKTHGITLQFFKLHTNDWMYTDPKGRTTAEGGFFHWDRLLGRKELSLRVEQIRTGGPGLKQTATFLTLVSCLVYKIPILISWLCI